jgi:hypothetical protein
MKYLFLRPPDVSEINPHPPRNLRYNKTIIIIAIRERKLVSYVRDNVIGFCLWRRAPQQMLRSHSSLKAYCATLVMKMKMKGKMISFIFP